MKQIRKKPLVLGIIFFIINSFILYIKLSNPLYNMVPNRADLMDGIFGFFLLAIFFVISISIIMYGLSIETKFSKFGKKAFDFLYK